MFTQRTSPGQYLHCFNKNIFVTCLQEICCETLSLNFDHLSSELYSQSHQSAGGHLVLQMADRGALNSDPGEILSDGYAIASISEVCTEEGT
jgi:hypothetical protein